jgi:hypothetical protein
MGASMAVQPVVYAPKQDSPPEYFRNAEPCTIPFEQLNTSKVSLKQKSSRLRISRPSAAGLRTGLPTARSWAQIPLSRFWRHGM